MTRLANDKSEKEEKAKRNTAERGGSYHPEFTKEGTRGGTWIEVHNHEGADSLPLSINGASSPESGSPSHPVREPAEFIFEIVALLDKVRVGVRQCPETFARAVDPWVEQLGRGFLNDSAQVAEGAVKFVDRA